MTWRRTGLSWKHAIFGVLTVFLLPKSRSAKIQVHASAEEWAEGFDSTGKTWLLHINGGEPSIYPGFINLCSSLSRNHYLSINSNLSGNCVEAFAETIDPKRVHFINAALHYVEREKKKPSTSLSSASATSAAAASTYCSRFL